ncbi:MAG: pyridoxal phosphate-dependent aminotransferase family protein [Saprospiraceae bacterium]|nr:pyridoxal phosphate-dependent aminotransferase family protein [Saprospiraceae bacterium]
MPVINNLPGRTLSIDNIDLLFFSGTSYLGIGHQETFRKALYDGFERYGSIYSASRNNNIQLGIYQETEKYLAEINDAEASITTSSGLLAGQLVVRSFEDHLFIYAPDVHPALWFGQNISSQFKDYDDFYSRINDIISKVNIPIVICCNSIDPLRCEKYNFNWVSSLPQDKDITLIFDDSHALGLVNLDFEDSKDFKHGFGNYSFFSALAPDNVRVIVISSLAKALGIPGGIIFGDLDVINKIKNSPYFIGASPIIPAYLDAFMKSQKHYYSFNYRLKENIDLFLSLNNHLLYHFRYLENYPVFFSPNNDLYQDLMRKNIFISSFAYPTAESTPITRIVLSSLHTDSDIRILSDALNEIFYN